ncbi:MAG: hypothetical protein Q9157_000603 [Trypethelium eluteriae]
MRTSRITQDAARAVGTSSSSRRSKFEDALPSKSISRSLRSFQYGADQGNPEPSLGVQQAPISQVELPPDNDISNDAESSNAQSFRMSSRKRKRSNGTPVEKNSKSTLSDKTPSPTVIEKRVIKEETISPSKPLPRKPRRAPAKRLVSSSGEVKLNPPPNWEQMYSLTKEMRSTVLAPVDTVGCERLADTRASPKDQRFQTLVALMLSSQTKDTVTAIAMQRLKEELHGGLTIQTLLTVPPETFNELIGKVGFHNTKTKNIIAAAGILARDYDSDIPSTIAGLISLPGVGPKMAHLTMSAAWGRTEGIGVDVHVHRITNLWGWHQTKNPEETRAILEAWLPKDKWHEINTLLVGLGQTICTPVARKCGDCVLGQKGLCPGAVREKIKKVKAEEAVEDVDGTAIKKQEVEVEVREDGKVDFEGEPPDAAQPPDIEDLGQQSRRRSGRLKRG